MEEYFKNIQKVNRGDPTPLYCQVTNSLQKYILNKKIESSVKLPTEDYLCNYFDVSRPTIKKAIELLEKKTLVYRQRGRGTFIKIKEFEVMLLEEPISFGNALMNAGVEYTTEVLEKKVIKGSSISISFYKLNRGEKYIYLKRLRYTEGVPFLLINSYIPFKLFPKILDCDFKNNMLISELKKEYGINIMKNRRSIRAIRVDIEDARHLRLKIGDPLLYLEGELYSSKNVIIEYYSSKLVSDRIVLAMSLYDKSFLKV